jgi:hypothetical protein
MSARGSDINNLARMRAILSSSSLLRVGAQIEWDRAVGRHSVNPPYVLLAYITLARLTRSGVRVGYDLANPQTWTFARKVLTTAIAEHGIDVPPPSERPPTWEHWRWLRDQHLSTDEGLAQLARAFPGAAADLARSIGLCRTDTKGSFSHPPPERCIYGDGTLVKPMYNTPETVTITLEDGTTKIAYVDHATGDISDEPPRRYDPDLQPHHGTAGPVNTHGYVAWHARGPAPYQRVVLAVDHIAAPGQEAATAVRLAGDVHRHLGSGVQAVVYDGAMQGVHIEEIMRRYGWLAIAKLPTGRLGPGDQSTFVNRAGRRVRTYPLGAVIHPTMTGPCSHQLAAFGGHVVELGLDDAGDPVVIAEPVRGAVKRNRRSLGEYRFNVGYRIDCPLGRFTTWLAPHPTRPGDFSRPHNFRIIPPDDADASRVRGLRNDAENFHSNYKRTLIVNRAMSRGWRRGLLDVYGFALYSNALTEHRAFLAATAGCRSSMEGG